MRKGKDMAVKTIYDMMREKAKAMGHAAANLPDSVWQQYLNAQDQKATLTEAKLYMENYMMGTLKPADLAQILADNDALRYTISDLCRIRLEPVELNVQRNDSYVDVGAGIRTFWTEIRVPLPSELDAARDIRNMNLGIEAARAAGAAFAKPAEEKSGRRSFRDIFNDAKRRAAEMAIEKLTPIAEGGKTEEETPEVRPLTSEWLETEDGQAYRDQITRQAAQQVENVVMDIEAGKDPGLHPDERKKAYEAAGVTKEQVEKLVLGEDYQNYGNLVEAYLAANDLDIDDLDVVYVSTSEQEKLLTETEMYTEEIVDETETEITVESDVPETAAELRSGFSVDDLNAPLNQDMQALFDQIMQHVNQNRTARDYRTTDQAMVQSPVSGPKAEPVHERKGYVTGEFEGKPVSFKGSFSSHTFTEEEVGKLLAGETISIEYTDKNQKTRTVSGKLEWQTYKDREFLGFKADYSKKAEQTDMVSNEQASSASLFDSRDEDLMHYYMAGGDEEPTYENVSESDEARDDYYARLAADMENYQSVDDTPYCSAEEDDVPKLSADDLTVLSDSMQL